MFSLFKNFHFQFFYMHSVNFKICLFACISNQTLVLCRVLSCIFSLLCIVVYYLINYLVCSFVYTRKRYTIHGYTKITCIKEFQNANNFNYTRLTYKYSHSKLFFRKLFINTITIKIHLFIQQIFIPNIL